MTNFKLTTKGHYITENQVFINHWNLKIGDAHVPYDKTEGPILTANSDDPIVIDAAARQWIFAQRLIEEERKNNDPVYLREQIARLLPFEKQITAINSLILNQKVNAVTTVADIAAVLKGYTSHKEMLKVEEKALKASMVARCKEMAAKKKAAIKDAKKAVGNKDAIVYQAEWLEYLNGNGHAYRGSRVCKAQKISKITADVVITETGKVYVNGAGKLKINLTNYSTGEIVRADYDMSNL